MPSATSRTTLFPIFVCQTIFFLRRAKKKSDVGWSVQSWALQRMESLSVENRNNKKKETSGKVFPVMESETIYLKQVPSSLSWRDSVGEQFNILKDHSKFFWLQEWWRLIGGIKNSDVDKISQVRIVKLYFNSHFLKASTNRFSHNISWKRKLKKIPTQKSKVFCAWLNPIAHINTLHVSGWLRKFARQRASLGLIW